MPKLLLIDDDEELCEELAQVLASEGFDVDVAMDGLQGLQYVQAGHYEVIILDLKLPGLDGFGVLQNVSKEARPPKVIVVSGRPMGDNLLKPKDLSRDAEDGILNLADVVVNKPFKVETLIQTVRQLLKPT
jgi:DNA-binding response OmpR family regulator